MKIFDYTCPKCKRITERCVEDFEKDDQWCECGNKLKREFTMGHVKIFQPYLDPHISKDGPVWIETEAQKKQMMKDQGLVLWGDVHDHEPEM